MDIKKGDILFDLYSVEEDAVETGSSSLVWKVHHIKWDTYMALKQPKENVIAENGGKENFLRECEMWVSLGFHPHIVPCYYVREIDGKPTMFSEWCDGGNLAENIKEGTLYKGTVKEQEQRIISIALQILLGLRYAHSKKVIHKDIKPANIMLTSEGVARITDFGSAGSQNETATITYRSPEQTPYDNGETVTLSQQITEKTDIYSWALTVLNMCAGFVYWEKGNEAEKYYHNYLTEFSVVINPMFKDLLFRCLAASPEQRPCADELIQSMRILFGEMLSDDIAMNYIDTEEIGGDADSLNNMALSYIDLKEYEKADKCWRKALSVSPFHPESTYNYNVYLWAMGRISNVTLRRQTEILSSERKELF
ncbi:MAG: protein kinase, partial [Oscillospiraceae bacterium]|nr:protein kinase [Oscillospiraceae bacterium]